MKLCTYLEQFIHSKFEILPSTSINPSPKVQIYTAKNGGNETIPIEELDTTAVMLLKPASDKNYKLYKPFNDDSAKVYLPAQGKECHNKEIEKIIIYFQHIVAVNWEAVTGMIKSRPDNVTAQKWGATMIQSDRCEIYLDFDGNETRWWHQFCNEFKFSKDNMQKVLTVAKQMTESDF